LQGIERRFTNLVDFRVITATKIPEGDEFGKAENFAVPEQPPTS
jgi:hypothetical protein